MNQYGTPGNCSACPGEKVNTAPTLNITTINDCGCPPGTYGGDTCRSCPAGQFAAAPTSAACTPCPVGHFCTEGASSPTACSIYQVAEEGSASCQACISGFKSANGAVCSLEVGRVVVCLIVTLCLPTLTSVLVMLLAWMPSKKGCCPQSPACDLLTDEARSLTTVRTIAYISSALLLVPALLVWVLALNATLNPGAACDGCGVYVRYAICDTCMCSAASDLNDSFRAWLWVLLFLPLVVLDLWRHPDTTMRLHS